MGQIDKHERFYRMAELRTNNVLKALRILGNCSNKHNYSYTAEDVKQIFDSIDKAVKEVKSAFEAESKNKQRFEFKNKKESN